MTKWHDLMEDLKAWLLEQADDGQYLSGFDVMEKIESLEEEHE